ncbi:MAG: homoserine dehydrogenase [Zetaproteobacteria bacterium CG12_big_fil_rev_8_21_14_0_65_54_13]|nr:MAG: homoserine dehydrogenase [Zetaproteobacteria bacterium CG12_big_fil_rev_8_21_14_0_65_54_13]PIX54875.1 MAG: homoserine dehydrogenase [Zetaproteobacteria bacterium CG_4_10_14_3_um_filter_54_28]PJA30342.1 MAG: homoserine dehydrogenase [Zetaproteobacteria bacterium CG_4_9_14_3_um_filter_54_145]
MTELRVGLLGLGTIGTGVARILIEQQALISRRLGKQVRLVAAADRELDRDRGLDFSGVRLSNDANDIVSADDVDLVVELIGGYEPACSFVIKALESGKHVVTANKALIAKHGEQLFPLAAANGLQIGFEAAVGGGIPCMKALREGLAANAIESVYGILNGTCNFILTKMENEGVDYADVLKEAQALGYAEADPAFDVEGIDTAQKLSILAAMAFGSKIRFEEVFTEGITGIKAGDIQAAHEMGYRIKLLGIAKPHGVDGVVDAVEMRVHPTLVPLTSQMAQVSDSYNAVQISGNYVEHTMYYGRGAGERPTASAVVADIMDIASGFPDGIAHLAPPMGFVESSRQDLPTMPMADTECEYFIRLMVNDQPGVIASVTSILADHRISLEALTQKERHKSHNVPIIMLTHETTEGNLQAAISRIIGLDAVEEDVLILRKESAVA